MDSLVTGIEPGTAAPANGTSQEAGKRISANAEVASDAARIPAAIEKAKATRRLRVAARDGVAA